MKIISNDITVKEVREALDFGHSPVNSLIKELLYAIIAC